MKKLNLNRTKYHDYILNELHKTYEISKEVKHNNLLIYKFLKTGEKQAQLNIYENIDGTTTLYFGVGGNVALSEKIANDILQISLVKTFISNSFYIKSIRDEDFESLVEIIVEYGNSIEDKIIDGNKVIIKLKGKQGDSIVITRHSNKAFQVQGKPMLLFNEIIEILSEYMAFEQIIEQQLSFYETNLTAADIRGELENKLPNSFALLENKLIVIITPCLALQKIVIELEDYSAFAYPILRAIEGVIKQIFKGYGITINNKEGFGEHIIKERFNNYILVPETNVLINNANISRKICNIYKYYNIHRHSLFHIDEDIITSKVITLQEANNIVTTSLVIIDDCYDCLN